MKNDLTALNNYLFEAIERINDDSLDEKELDAEIKRGEAVQKIAQTIIQNGNLALNAKKHLDEYGQGDRVEIPLLGMMDK
ncbi:MAG: hypothetical protein PHY47_20635 [Lachnospiraceae bacterium]|nr:hypothetical protein [Lachnospiraceae bacterium]